MPPANDDLANAVVLTGTGGVVTGSIVDATVESGEDNRFGGHSIWYAYTPASNGLLTIDLSGSNFDTYLIVYVGGFAYGNVMLGLYEADDGFNVESDDEGDGQTSLIENLHVTGGTTYLIRVDSFGSLEPGEGDVVLTWAWSATPVSGPGWGVGQWTA